MYTVSGLDKVLQLCLPDVQQALEGHPATDHLSHVGVRLIRAELQTDPSETAVLPARETRTDLHSAAQMADSGTLPRTKSVAPPHPQTAVPQNMLHLLLNLILELHVLLQTLAKHLIMFQCRSAWEAAKASFQGQIPDGPQDRQSVLTSEGFCSSEAAMGC